MWFAVYEAQSGVLHSVGTVLADPLPAGLLAKFYNNEQNLTRWNPITREFDNVLEVVLLPQDFMGRFTFAEEVAIRTLAKTDASMETFLARVARARTVTLSHPDTINGVNYCVAKGCITAQRAQEIMNG